MSTRSSNLVPAWLILTHWQNQENLYGSNVILFTRVLYSKKSILVRWSTVLGCHAENENTIGSEQSADAFIYDSNMYADGYELHLQLDLGNSSQTGTLYKFTSATVPLVQRVIAEASPNPNEMVRLPVKLRYVATTN